MAVQHRYAEPLPKRADFPAHFDTQLGIEIDNGSSIRHHGRFSDNGATKCDVYTAARQLDERRAAVP